MHERIIKEKLKKCGYTEVVMRNEQKLFAQMFIKAKI